MEMIPHTWPFNVTSRTTRALEIEQWLDANAGMNLQDWTWASPYSVYILDPEVAAIFKLKYCIV